MILKVHKNSLVKENVVAKLLRPKKAKKPLLSVLFPPYFNKFFKSGMSHPQQKDLALVLYGLYPNGAGADQEHSEDFAAFVLNTYFYFVPEAILKPAIAGVLESYAPQDGEVGIIEMLRKKLLFEFGISEEWNWNKAMQLGLKSLNNGKNFSPEFLDALENLKETDKKKYLG